MSWGDFKQAWDDSKQVLKGTKIWDPLEQKYVDIQPQAMPAKPVPDLSEPGPNSTEARLQHIEILVANGSITEQQGKEQTDRILQGI